MEEERRIADLSDEMTEGEDTYHHSYSEDHYVKPDNPLIEERLEWFRDQKLGFMMHWGPYSQLGIMESWGVCDEEWTYSANDWQKDRRAFKEDYFGLNRTFNPVRFQPEVWTKMMADNGFRYLIFTTKHHDGFCMWDTKYSDYKITAPDCPFSRNRYADVCKHLFDAGRKNGLAIAAYFSKADWSSPYYWEDKFADNTATGRNPTYNTEEQPEKWQKFCDFTRNQILELMENYGRIDILWLDAGQVSPQNHQDIHLGEIVEEARAGSQPWLISADRTVGGPYENYITPEQLVPPHPMNIPWESCITLGTSFSYRYDDNYKSAREVVALLVDIIVKGGNLALNVGPQPDGRIPAHALEVLNTFGAWMRENGDAVYGTRPAKPYRRGDFGFTRKKDTVYAIQLLQEDAVFADKVLIPYRRPVTSVSLVGQNIPLAFTRTEAGLEAVLPDALSWETGKAPLALSFAMKEY